MTRKDIAETLKRLRNNTGLTADEVGVMISKSGKTVNAWENNRGQPDAETLILLCDIYKVENILEEFKRGTNLSSTTHTTTKEENLKIPEPDRGIIKKFLQLSERNKIKIEGKIEDYLEEQQKNETGMTSEIIDVSAQDASNLTKNKR